MTKRNARSTVKAAAAKRSVTKSSAVPAIAATPTLIVLGFDEQQNPRGARFVDAKPDLVTKAVDAMGFKVLRSDAAGSGRYRQETARRSPLRQRPRVRAKAN